MEKNTFVFTAKEQTTYIKNKLEVKNFKFITLKTFEENHIRDTQEPKHNSDIKGGARKEGNGIGVSFAIGK